MAATNIGVYLFVVDSLRDFLCLLRKSFRFFVLSDPFMHGRQPFPGGDMHSVFCNAAAKLGARFFRKPERQQLLALPKPLLYVGALLVNPRAECALRQPRERLLLC